VLILVSDDQRADSIGAYGNTIIETPNLDRLAREGSLFHRAVCGNPICTPSRAEIMTGCSGFQNGVVDFGGKIDPSLTRWATAMGNAGYQTWYVGKWHNNGAPHDHGYQATAGWYRGGGGKWWKDQTDHHGRPVTGYRGWIFHSDKGEKLPDLGVGLTGDISAKFADAAIEVIERPRKQPFFLHVNFTAPHDPLHMPTGLEGKYKPREIPLPRNFRSQHPFDHGNFMGRDEVLLPFPRTKKDVQADLAVYYSVVDHMDQQIGRIFAALKSSNQWDNTLVIFTSDHGLAMGSHGLRGKQNMYEHTINVPMIIRGPKVPANRKFDAQMYLRDMYPTVCELTGVPIPKSVTAKSVVPVLNGKAQRVHEFTYCYFRKFQRMIRTDRWKLIHYPEVGKWQLFDLTNDPKEITDLIDSEKHIDVRDRLTKMLKKQMENE